MEESAERRSAPFGARIVVPGAGAVNPSKCTTRRVSRVPFRPNRAMRHASLRMNGSATPEVSGYVLDVIGHAHPPMHAFFVNRDGGRGKRRIRKRANGYRDGLVVANDPVNDCATLRTKPKRGLRTLVSDPNVFRAGADDGDRPAREARLRPKDTPRTPLTRQAVANADANRVPGNLRLQLAAAARGDARTRRRLCGFMLATPDPGMGGARNATVHAACPPGRTVGPSSHGWRRHDGILILHDQPSRATFCQDKRAYVLLVHVPYAVGARKGAHATGYRRNRGVFACKAHVQLFDVVRHTVQKSAMHFVQFLEDGCASMGPAAVGIDVVPVVGCEIGRMAEPMGVEGGVERLNRLAHGCFGTRALRKRHHRHGQKDNCRDERFHDSSEGSNAPAPESSGANPRSG